MTTPEVAANDTATPERITLRNIASQLPWAARKLPSLLKGYYYFALLKPQKPSRWQMSLPIMPYVLRIGPR